MHGGIGFTWEHDAHLYLRRAAALEAVIDSEAAAIATTDLTRAGVTRDRTVDLPPEAEAIRDRGPGLRRRDQGPRRGRATRRGSIDSGYVMPHWPEPYGRAAGAVEQLVIEQEFAAAKIQRPAVRHHGLGDPHAHPARHRRSGRPLGPVRRSPRRSSGASCSASPTPAPTPPGSRPARTRVDGGWLVNGQKVWTSGAHVAGRGLATVRTNPDAPKHNGITTMVIDMHAEGVEVRPLKMPTGSSEFNEVFFNDVFVPDDDVVGPVDGGWTVARATLGNESVSIGGGSGGMTMPGEALIPVFDAHPERLSGGARPDRPLHRGPAGDGACSTCAARTAPSPAAAPGRKATSPSSCCRRSATRRRRSSPRRTGPDTAFLDGAGAMAGMLILMHRAMSIAGGTSEIKRNQIGERILGLPRDPLIN